MTTLVSSSPITFQAQWNEKNKHLAETCFEKVTRTVLFLLNNYIAGMLLPAIKKSKGFVRSVGRDFSLHWSRYNEYNKFLVSHYTPKPIEVTTPDGIKLRGTLFKNAAARESSPTVIFYQPNAMISKQGGYDWVMAQAALLEFPCNFVYFDYRACGESDGVAPHSKKDLFLDGESIYQFVREKLHVPPKDIHFYGWSLGGGIGSNIKGIDEEREGNFVNERSFNLIRNVIKNFQEFISFGSPLLNTIKNAVFPALAAIAGMTVSALNWNIDGEMPIEKLKGKTLIVHHPEDELMQKEASLFQSLFRRGVAPSSNIQELNLGRYPGQSYFFVHGAPLNMFDHQDFKPKQEIARFLFSLNGTYNERMLGKFTTASAEFKNKVFNIISYAYQNGGLYWGSAEDAFYNRNGLSLTDEMRVKAITLAKLEG